MIFLYVCETIAVCYIEHNIRRFIEQTVLGFITLADFYGPLVYYFRGNEN